MRYGKEFYNGYRGQFAGDTVSKSIVKLTEKYIKGNVLDVGAGSGALIDYIKSLNHNKINQVVGIDISPTRKDIIECSSDDILFESNKFNTIMLTAVIEHLDSDLLENTLNEIHRVLKPGGYFIITTAYKEDLDSLSITCPRCNSIFHRWGHVKSYDEEVMRCTIGNRFKIVEMYRTYLTFVYNHPRLKWMIPIVRRYNLFGEMEYLVVVARKSEKMKIEVEGYEALEKTVTASGNSGRVYAPHEWVGKRVKIILLEPLEK